MVILRECAENMHVSTGNVEAALNFSPAEFKQSAPRAQPTAGNSRGKSGATLAGLWGVTWPVEKA
jgi:hypothetical protein